MWARWLMFTDQGSADVMDGGGDAFRYAAVAEDAWKAAWNPLVSTILGWPATTWYPRSEADLEVFARLQADCERNKHQEGPEVTKAMYGKARGNGLSLTLIFAALRVASEGGEIGQWTGQDAMNAFAVYENCIKNVSTFAIRHQEHESSWSVNARKLLERSWLRE